MWKELPKYPTFFILYRKRLRHHILITDYIRIWEVYYSEDEFITRLKESNSGLEMDNNEFLDKGLQMLHRPSELKKLEISTNGLILTVSMSMLFGFPLKLVINLEEGSRELFFQKITQPALKIIQDLRNSEQQLRKMLCTKDDEIEEYKSFGGKIRYTAIPPYNDELHMKKHCMYSAQFGDTELPTSILDRLVGVPQEKHIIKEETVDTKLSIKLEATSQEITTPQIIMSIGSTMNNIKNEHGKAEILRPQKRKLNI